MIQLERAVQSANQYTIMIGAKSSASTLIIARDKPKIRGIRRPRVDCEWGFAIELEPPVQFRCITVAQELNDGRLDRSITVEDGLR